MEDRAHALYSPSATYRNLSCVGSLKVVEEAKKLGLVKESVYAKWGTDCHEYAKEALETIHSQNHYNFDKILDPEKREVVFKYCGFIGEINTQFRKNHKGVRHYIEHRVKYDDTLWGTADYILTGHHKDSNKFEVVFCDLKAGKGVEVSAEDNEQLLAYIICLQKQLGTKIEEAHCFIFQPRTPGKEFTRWSINHETIYRSALGILKNKEHCIEHLESGKLGERCDPGEWCRFCPGKEFHNGKTLCTAFSDDVNSTKLKILESVPEVPTLQGLTLEDKVQIFKRRKIFASLIDDICKDVLQHALKEKIPGFKIVPSQQRRSWIKGDVEKQSIQLIKMGVVEPLKKSLIGIGEVEKQIGKGKIDDMTQLSKPGYQLVPDDDKRSEIKQIGLEGISEIEFTESD